MVYRVTCVCLGNICRSPMAEAVLRHRLGEAGLTDEVAVDSAGTGAWHEGDDADPRALAALTAAGYHLDHTGRQFQADWFAESDLILAMDAENLANLRNLAATYGHDAAHVRLFRSFDPAAPPGAEVPDPYFGGSDGFRTVLDMLERAADGVMAFVDDELAGRR
jgi:protein-tyrosine phosphatase